MAKYDLRRFAENDGGGIDPTYVGYNFDRIDLVSEVVRDVNQGIASVTGTLTLATDLASVEGVCVSLAVSPVAAACFVSATIVPNSGQITISVWTNAFAAAAIVAVVQWIAVGVLTL